MALHRQFNYTATSSCHCLTGHLLTDMVLHIFKISSSGRSLAHHPCYISHLRTPYISVQNGMSEALAVFSILVLATPEH